MSNTILPATVEVAHRTIRGCSAKVDVITSLSTGATASLEVSQEEGKVRLAAEVKVPGKTRYEGVAFMTLDRETAETLCRNLAVRLGLKLEK